MPSRVGKSHKQAIKEVLMYKIQIEYLGCMHEYMIPKLIESFSFKSKQEALEKYRILLATYLVGYGVLWDNINEKEHEKRLLAKSLEELKDIESKALFNKELDYKISFVECV